MKRFYNREKSKRIFVFQRITQSYTPLFTTTYYLLLCLNFVKKRQTFGGLPLIHLFKQSVF